MYYYCDFDLTCLNIENCFLICFSFSSFITGFIIIIFLKWSVCRVVLWFDCLSYSNFDCLNSFDLVYLNNFGSDY